MSPKLARILTRSKAAVFKQGIALNHQILQKNRLATARIVAIYSLFGLAWIYGSDSVLGWLVDNPATMVKIAVIKGSLFILCTSTLLYFLIIRFVRQLAVAERELIESFRNYEAIFNSTNEAILIHDAHSGRILDINERMLEIYGYERHEALALDIGELSEGKPPYSQAEAVENVRRAMSAGPQTFEWLARKKTGELFWSETSLRRFTDHDYDRIIAVVRDISQRIQAERALKESNYKIMSLVDSVPGQIAFVNAETLQYEFVNNEFEKSSGIPRGKIIGSHLEEIIGASDYQSALKYIEVVRSGKSVSCEKAFDLVSGRRWIQVNYNPIIEDNGHVTSIVVHSFDITNLKEHEKEQLKIEKLESLGILAGGIAHDFNNILTGIMGNISLASKHLDDTHRAFKPLLEAEKASLRAADLARQLLTFGRGGDPVKKTVSLRQLINESVSLVLSGSNIKGIVYVPDSIHALEADEGQLNQVFNNIIINAMHAMPRGGALTIAAQNVTLIGKNVMSLPAGSYIYLTFTDEGCGISAADLEKIFDPYFTTKPDGNGLGLASAHSIITKHGGHIGASSVLGKGTTIIIHLPSSEEKYPEYQAEVVAKVAEGERGGSILVMDDEEMIRNLAAAMLAEMGYQVTTCENGVDAIAHYRTAMDSGAPFSAVIMDVTIPGGMGGREAAEKILSVDAKANLIVSSGYSNDPIMADFTAYGFVAAVAKPYRFSQLELVLGSLPADSSAINNGIK